MRFALARRTESLIVLLDQNSPFVEALLSTLGMERGRGGGAARFGTCEVEIYHYGVLTASDHHSFTGFVGESVYLLVRHEWRNIDEVTWPGFTAEFEVVSPAHASPAANDIEDRFELAVVMRSRFRVGLDYHRAGPQFTCSRSGVCNGGRPGHTRSLGRVRVQLAGGNDFDAVALPVHD